MKRWIVLCVVSLVLPVSARDRRYVGAEKCRSCHEKAFQIWAVSGHAKAQSELTDEKKGELRCLFCHATDVSANFRQYRLQNVQCEGCHGPGERHIQLAEAREAGDKGKPAGLEPITEKRCRECHAGASSPTLRPFDFSRAKEVIKHW